MPLSSSSRNPVDLRPWERAALMLGTALLIVARLFHLPWAMTAVGPAALILLGGLLLAAVIRYISVPPGPSRRWRAGDALLGLWLFGSALAPFLEPRSPLQIWVAFAEFILALRIAVELAPLPRALSTQGWNPAFVFVGSFVALIGAGTLLLMLPDCRTQTTVDGAVPTDWLTALFTSTSASCVTGLAVVDTSSHWSRAGLVVIMLLIQFGGLGVMTFGAFFALGSQRGFFVREGVFMGSLLEQDDRAAVRRLVRSVLVFTAVSELTGAALMLNLSGNQPLGDRIFSGLFHAVSSFCNAGFALFPRSLEQMEMRFEVWGVIAGLIVIGGLGFDTLQNTWGALFDRIRKPPPGVRPRRLSLTSRIVLITTTILLLTGTLGFLFFERADTLATASWPSRISHAWFQSVTCRTAGFNTLDFGKMHPASKLFAIILLVIGASPGSTGGGVKTVSFALVVMAAWSIIRRRETIELFGRTVPDGLVKRAAMIVAVALAIVLAGTMLITLVENQPAKFLDHLFEVVSAFATVGLSTGITADLQPTSKMVLIAAMFIGRVGPITMLLALTRTNRAPKYEYPTERVALG